jgi:NAD(P)-dependent dehydrogenase (short-subunit alcohol dehydrogenase family)
MVPSALHLSRQSRQLVAQFSRMLNRSGGRGPLCGRGLISGAAHFVGVDADVSEVADLQMLVDTAVKPFGRLDIMVNNAGVETRTNVQDTTEAQYELGGLLEVVLAGRQEQQHQQSDR